MSAGIPVEITESVLDEDSRTVMSAGISVEVAGSGIIELGDNSGTVVSAGSLWRSLGVQTSCH